MALFTDPIDPQESVPILDHTEGLKLADFLFGGGIVVLFTMMATLAASAAELPEIPS